MKVILFGASGMVGQGVLRECLAAADVERVLAVVRRALPTTHPKLEQLELADFFDYRDVAARFEGYDACFFCLGVSAAGMPAADYERATYTLTLAAAETLARVAPGMTFIYVSGEGTDSTEQGRSRWARVKGRTENALLRLPFRAAFMFRPGYIQPMDGIVSKTTLYRILYNVVAPLYPLLKRLFPRSVTTTRQVGRAMLAVARDGAPASILRNSDINRIAGDD